MVSSTLASQAEADLSAHTGRLRFPAPLERAYRHDRRRKLLRSFRSFLWVVAALFALWGALDPLLLPRSYRVVWRIRAGGEVLILGTLWLACSAPRLRRLWLLTVWSLFLVILPVVAMMAAARPDEAGALLYPIAILYFIIVVYTASGHFWHAAVAGWAIIPVYLGVGLLCQPAWRGGPQAIGFYALVAHMVTMNVLGMAIGAGIELASRRDFLLRRLIQAQRRASEDLLLNTLPAPVAERLKRGEIIADQFEVASVLFADMAGFTPLSARRTPQEVVSLLGRAFSAFDRLADRHGLEKIKTIGDAYMVVGGVPLPRPDHARAIAEMALDMMAEMETLKREGLGEVQLRIGIHCGPVVAGVIGLKKYVYDLWGDTVNTASRMESHGRPGHIQVSSEFRALLGDGYLCQERGVITVKGKGSMRVYFLLGRAAAPAAASPAAAS